MIKGREGNRGSSSSSSSAYSADLLVCFPTRAHLALTPKPICSPSRTSDSTNRRPHHRRQISRLSGGNGIGGGQQHGSSPVLWAKQASKKNMGGDLIAEPTSPKVTCAGQIKVRPSKCSGKGKNWQSVMEEIERIHVNRSQSKFLGFKKDVMGFLTCLRNIKFDFRCFGDFRHVDVTSDDEEDEDDEEEEEVEEEESSKTVFSKWFMVLQEEESNNDDEDKKIKKCVVDEKNDLENAEPAVPPPNALLLMRCRSAPAKSWLEERMQTKTEQEKREKDKEEEEEEETEEEEEMKKKKDLRSLMEEEKMEFVLMRYDTDYYKLSSDIAKETWVVGGINQDPLSRSRSLKS